MTDLGYAPFRVTVERTDDRAVLSCSGELDLATADDLTTAVKAVLQDSPEAILIVFDDATFVDSSGLRALLEAIQDCRDSSIPVHVRPGATLQRLLDLVQIDLPRER
jgi:anti-sigma B factor antagonist